METENKNNLSFLSYFLWTIPILLIALIASIIFYTPDFQDKAYMVKAWFKGSMEPNSLSVSAIQKKGIKSQQNCEALEKKLDLLKPVKPYIVVNTTENRFSLRNENGDTIKTGVCSTGKNELLIAGAKRIVFKTPKGLFTVKNKQQSRPWVKPDWAYIEDGLPIPPARSADRIDYATLGDYALEIGNGYMLHGTLYQRFLGLPVTHGCVRLGDKDLELIYNTLSKGSKVFIY